MLQTTVDSHAEFVVDSLRYVQPVQFVMHYYYYYYYWSGINGRLAIPVEHVQTHQLPHDFAGKGVLGGLVESYKTGMPF